MDLTSIKALSSAAVDHIAQNLATYSAEQLDALTPDLQTQVFDAYCRQNEKDTVDYQAYVSDGSGCMDEKFVKDEYPIWSRLTKTQRLAVFINGKTPDEQAGLEDLFGKLELVRPLDPDFSRFPCVQELSLKFGVAHKVNQVNLTVMPLLRSLTIYQAALRKDCEVKVLPASVFNDTLRSLSQCKQLEELCLESRSLTELPILAELKALRKLTLTACPFEFDKLAEVFANSSLESLTLAYADHISTEKGGCAFPTMVYRIDGLKFRMSPDKMEQLTALIKGGKLKELSLTGVRIPYPALQELVRTINACPHFARLTLDQVTFVPEPHTDVNPLMCVFTDTCGLKTLCLRNVNEVTSVSQPAALKTIFESVRNLHELECLELSLDGIQPQEVGLKETVTACAKLQTLTLRPASAQEAAGLHAVMDVAQAHPAMRTVTIRPGSGPNIHRAEEVSVIVDWISSVVKTEAHLPLLLTFKDPKLALPLLDAVEKNPLIKKFKIRYWEDDGISGKRTRTLDLADEKDRAKLREIAK